MWKHDFDNVSLILDLGVRTHPITAHFALPLLIERPGGMRAHAGPYLREVQEAGKPAETAGYR